MPGFDASGSDGRLPGHARNSGHIRCLSFARVPQKGQLGDVHQRSQESFIRQSLSLLIGAAALVLASASVAQQALVIRPLAERKVPELPGGELVWRIENFPSKASAESAAGTWSLVAEAAGRAWLFTLGSAGGSSPAGAHGTLVVKAGTPAAGHGASMAMQVSSSGSSDLQSLVMFVVDATQPFSSPASLP